jgi:hypothetical protein
MEWPNDLRLKVLGYVYRACDEEQRAATRIQAAARSWLISVVVHCYKPSRRPMYVKIVAPRRMCTFTRNLPRNMVVSDVRSYRVKCRLVPLVA